MSTQSICNYSLPAFFSTKLSSNKISTAIVIFLLLLVNVPLFFGAVATELIFFPESVVNGEVWRIVTHPLVHLSWYHLLLDGAAFLLLFAGLEERRLLLRSFYAGMAALGALGFGLLFEPKLGLQGLCGLSGAAHGLMAVSALEMIRGNQHRLLGGFCLVAVIGKCLYEFLTGQVLFEFLQFGLTGQPVAASHAGGLVGGVLSGAIIMLLAGKWRSKHRIDRP